MLEEDEVVEMTENEEMQFCGLTGDDEDDLFGDAEELLGRHATEDLFDGSAAHPHPVDDDMAPIVFHAADGNAGCNIPDVTDTKIGSCHHKHCIAYLLSTS